MAATPSRARLPKAAREMQPHAENAARFLRALANEQRLMLLCNLLDGPLTVGELNARVPLSQSALSQHLGVLREAGVVTTERQAQNVIYALPPGAVTRIIRILKDQFCG
jgi:ArsR family transcriptional regulator, virulence genes transcriptional regulator